MFCTMKWKKRSLFVLLTAVLISVAIAAACIFFIPPLRKKLEKREKPSYSGHMPVEQYISGSVCASEDCVLAAAEILKYMNTKVDPCDDFYNYSCGKFLSSHSIPDGWNSFGIKDIHDEKLDVAVKWVLEQPALANQSNSLTKAQEVYKTCIDTNHIDEHGVDDLKELLSNTGVGDWPFLHPEWKDCRLDIEWRMAKLNAMGLDSLFHLETQFGGDDHKLFAILRPAEPLVDGICDDDPDNITIVLERASEHREILVSVLELMGVEITNVTDLDIDDLFEFDFLFCNATKEYRMKPRVEDVDSLNMTLLQLANMAPQINWMRWRNIVFSELRLSFPHDRENIYIDGLQTVILKINDLLHRTTSKAQANYLSWRFVFQHLGFLGKDFRQIIESHSRIVSPKLGKFLMHSDRWIPRWRQCVIYVKTLMPLSIMREFGDHISMAAREKEMDSITPLVTDEFQMIMKDSKDLKKTDQMRSSHKISFIQFPLTYLYEERIYNNFYSDVGSISESFLKNGLRLSLSRMRKLLEGVSRNKRLYEMLYAVQTIYPPFGSDMYSFFEGNQIVVSLGALQSCPLNSKFIPKFMTLSTLGWRVGHELAHGFDLLALDGSSGQNWTWWDKRVAQHAKAKADCFLKFYSNRRDITVDEAIKSTTLNEDICDNQGMVLAHRAYLRYLSQSSYEDPSLPGLPLSNRELFFVTYAQQFCELRRNDNSGRVAPGRRRVNQVLQNYAPFSQIFNCGKEKPMNPPKCESLFI